MTSGSSGNAPTPPDLFTERLEFRVTGLDCAEEVALLRRALAPLPGVHGLSFDVFAQRLAVEVEPGVTDAARLQRAIAATGLRASAWDAPAPASERPALRLVLTSVAGAALLAGFVGHLLASGSLEEALAGHDHTGPGHDTPLPAQLAYLIAVAAGLVPLLPKALSSLRALRPDMNLLMTVAIGGALALGDFFEAGTVAFLFALSLELEAWSVGRARRALASLMALSPREAEIMHADGTCGHGGGHGAPHGHRVAADSVAVGSIVLVRPGERVPLDGRIVSGSSDVDLSPLTGEHVPVARGPGEEVWAGAINGAGALEIRTTRVAQDTTLARIVRLVGEAQQRRSHSERLVERFARIYTPAVMALAVLVAALAPPLFGQDFGEAVYHALVLLVIACPCALVISTPVSVVCAIGAAARRGVLVKGGQHMESPARLAALAFDKTGTLTAGRPRLRRVLPFEGHDEPGLLRIAAALEMRARHPLGEALLAAADARGVRPAGAVDVRAIPGRGLSGAVGGTSYWLGSHRLLEERGQETPEVHAMLLALEAEGQTAVILGNERHVCGVFVLGDEPRPEAAATVAELRGLGLSPLVLLTGDNAATAAAIGRRLALDEVRAGLLPEEKLAAIDALTARHGAMGMVGDGVNDAPAMARASVGIAMGAAGADAAIETADIVIMSDELSRLPWLVRHSRRTVAIIRQNIVAAVGIKAVFIVAALGGWASLWGAIAADMGVSLLVVLNGLRLLRPADDAPSTG